MFEACRIGRRSLVIRIGIALASASVCVGTTSAEESGGPTKTTWPQSHYNPAPADGDITLPMPCGAAMVFRRVDTQTQRNWLADENVQLGYADASRKQTEDPRFARLAGGFSDGSDPSSRHYFIGKYEVTASQYKAVMEDKCPAEVPKEDKPVGEAGWYDAQDFTRRYTSWLMKNAPEALPTEEGKPGFIRLPTEVEWEYAARGGQQIKKGYELSRFFEFKDGELDDYAWFKKTGSCEGGFRPVGLKRANPIGLHDVLGNASEIVFDLFHLTSPGRLHGQAGGFITKGGSCFNDEAALRLASRSEQPFFDAKPARPTWRRSLVFVWQ